jgi:hypothetical protein
MGTFMIFDILINLYTKSKMMLMTKATLIGKQAKSVECAVSMFLGMD